MNKIIRTICYFTENLSLPTLDKVNKIADILTQQGFTIQTKRICCPNIEKINQFTNQPFLFSVGKINKEQIDPLINTENIFFNTNLIDVNILYSLLQKNPSKTFNFAYAFNIAPSTPFFPSSTYQQNGFSIGLQPTNLAKDCQSLEEWLNKLKQTWFEIYNLFKNDPDFLGIDSSIASLFGEQGSLINFIKKLNLDFAHSTTTDAYLRITNFIKQENPKPIGLCGIMFPCLEDFELADEYSKGNFTMERNVYLSLHSGLGIDTYPIGIDEKPQRVLEILKLVEGLSNKYQKSLAIRFVADGKTKIGAKTDFQNQYLKDVIIRKL